MENNTRRKNNNNKTKKRSRSFNINDPDTYLGDKYSLKGKFLAMSSQPSFSKSSKRQQNNLKSMDPHLNRRYNNGNTFKKVAIQIKNYNNLVKGNRYHIGYGDAGNHAYYFTGEFVELDHGDAIFENYSQKNNEGKKDEDVTTARIKPIEKQKGIKRHIYKLAVRPTRKNLPNSLMREIRSFINVKKPNKNSS